MNSRVHPNYKTKYRVTNWAEYDSLAVLRYSPLKLDSPAPCSTE